MSRTQILQGDCRATLATLPARSIQTCVTSPPYFGLRDYGMDEQIGLEQTPESFVAELVAVFREVHRVLRDDGTLWLNLGDSYAGSGRGGYAGGKTGLQGSTAGQDQSRVAKGSQIAAGFHSKQVDAGALARAWVPPPPPPGFKNKDLIGIPWRVAFALQADGWYLRQDIIWSKPNPMPESVTDRCTKAHEYVFLLSKSSRYYFDHHAMQEPAVYAGGQQSQKRGEFSGKGAPTGREPFRAVRETRNKRSVWTVATKPYKGAHFATFPAALIEPCVRAGAPINGVVLDPFNGSGTTGEVALLNGRKYIGCELNPEYIALTEQRLAKAREEVLW